LGKIINDDLHISVFDSLEILSAVNDKEYYYLNYSQPEEEMEAGTSLKFFGTLHSHPTGSTKPSEQDISDFLDKHNNEDYGDEEHEWEYLHDEIMGIMGIKKHRKVIQYGLVFYDIDMKPIEVIISEDRDDR
jgi:hypothetical protein